MSVVARPTTDGHAKFLLAFNHTSVRTRARIAQRTVAASRLVRARQAETNTHG